MIRVIWKRARVIAGMIRALRPEAVSNPVVHQPISTTSPRPNVGSHRRITPNKRISKIPIRKVGRDMPMSERDMKARDSQLSRLIAV